MAYSKINQHGGKRQGAGRPRLDPTIRVRLPLKLWEAIARLTPTRATEILEKER